MTPIKLKLSSQIWLSITVPDLPNKYNYFYKPTKSLHQFDEATVLFFSKAHRLEVIKNALQEIACPLYTALIQACNHQLKPQFDFTDSSLGIKLNNILQEVEENTDDISPFWVWSSSKNVATLLYNKNNTIHLEIVPTYQWIFKEPQADEAYQTFEEFIQGYQPYLSTTISSETAQIWLKKLKSIIKRTNMYCSK